MQLFFLSILLCLNSLTAISNTILSSGTAISKLGIGTWAWGDKFYWKYDSEKDDELRETFDYCLTEGNINFFDTAEIYGLGRSELLLGRFNRKYNNVKPESASPVLATKYAPLPFRFGSKSVIDACQESLDRMGLEKMGIYQLHWPSLFQNEALWDGLARCYEKGLIESVGVSNYGTKLMTDVYKYLKERGIPLATNQIQYSLLCRSPETSGLLKAAQDMNITILAYSPLAQGLLTGKYNINNLPTGPRNALTKSLITKADPLIVKLKSIADSKSESTGMSITSSQVALNWCIAKGTVPIPGARSVAQAKDNCNALKWSLEPKEVTELDTVAKQTEINIASPLQSK